MDELVKLAYRPLSDSRLESIVAGEPYRRFLYYLCRDKVSLELGVDGGTTSALMAASASFHIGVDSRGLPETSPARQFPSFKFLFCDTLGAAKVVAGLLGKRKIDVVFQDSSHHAEPSRLEWEYYADLLAPNFVWVCDDITPTFKMPDEPAGMVEYFHSLPGRKYVFPGLHLGNVIGVVTP